MHHETRKECGSRAVVDRRTVAPSLFLAMADAAPHAALLSSNLATTFPATTTGHALSPGRFPSNSRTGHTPTLVMVAAASKRTL